MESFLSSFKVFLNRKSFSSYGYVICLLQMAASVLKGIFGFLLENEKEKFKCPTNDSKDEKYLQSECYDQYDELYNSYILLHGSEAIHVVSFVVGILYSCCVESCIARIEKICNRGLISTSSPSSSYVFSMYLFHLILRCILGILPALLQMKKMLNPFPSSFSCKPNSTADPIQCNISSSFTRNKTNWLQLNYSICLLLAVLILLEIIYLLKRICRDRIFSRDFDFCKNYLLHIDKNCADPIKTYKDEIRNRTGILKLSSLKYCQTENTYCLDKFYIDPDIYHERIIHKFEGIQKREELVKVCTRAPNNQKISRENLFDSSITSSETIRTILIVGRPGIGKSLLCTKMIREWIQGTLQNTDNAFEYVFLFKFEKFNRTGDEEHKMSLKNLIAHAEFSNEGLVDPSVLQLIIDNPKNILFIFDGLDEYKYRERIKGNHQFKMLDKPINTDMPVSSLYYKLIKSELLCGATVVTTTRPDILVESNLRFHKVVEILGFSPDEDKIESYAYKFDTDSKIFNKIKAKKDKINLRYLCYIPDFCYLICAMDLESISKIPFAYVYEKILKHFLINRHRGDENNKPTVENLVEEFGELAAKGMYISKFAFDKAEVENKKDFGVLNCMPSMESVKECSRPLYCFLLLTLQEYIAAKNIVSLGSDEMAKVLKTIIRDKNCEFVIQCIKELIRKDDKLLPQMICAYECQDEDFAKTLNLNKKSNGDIHLALNDLGIQAVHCVAIVYTLRHLKSSSYELNLNSNIRLHDNGCKELAALFKEACPKDLKMMRCSITDNGVSFLCKALEKHGKCVLLRLDLGKNNISDKGVKHVCDLLKQDSCKLSELTLENNHQISDESISNLIAAFNENQSGCQLTELNLLGLRLTDSSVLMLCDYFKVARKCKLSKLLIGSHPNQITDASMKYLQDAIQGNNCPLSLLSLESDGITDGGVRNLSQALLHNRCQITSLCLQSDNITNQGVQELCKVLRNKNCKVASVELLGKNITDEHENQMNECIQNRPPPR